MSYLDIPASFGGMGSCESPIAHGFVINSGDGRCCLHPPMLNLIPSASLQMLKSNMVRQKVTGNTLAQSSPEESQTL